MTATDLLPILAAIETGRPARELESQDLEFKEAKSRFDFELLVRYCCAIANEGGGHVIF